MFDTLLLALHELGISPILLRVKDKPLHEILRSMADAVECHGRCLSPRNDQVGEAIRKVRSLRKEFNVLDFELTPLSEELEPHLIAAENLISIGQSVSLARNLSVDLDKATQFRVATLLEIVNVSLERAAAYVGQSLNEADDSISLRLIEDAEATFRRLGSEVCVDLRRLAAEIVVAGLTREDSAGDTLQYLGILLEGVTATRAGYDKVADFGGKAKPLRLFTLLLESREDGMEIKTLHGRIYVEPRTDNALHQLKASSNKVLEAIQVSIESDGRGIWRVLPLLLSKV